MTRRRELELHRHSLSEIREIMNSMKTLAFMETRKLSRFIDAQQAVVANIRTVAGDLLSFYPEILPAAASTPSVCLLLGTERGFCGDFNQSLLQHPDISLQDVAGAEPILVVIGHKLQILCEGDTRVVGAIDGASAAEEVPQLLGKLVNELVLLQSRYGPIAVYCIHHNSDEKPISEKLLPPFEDLVDTPPRFSAPPVLNLEPHELLTELTEHYLFAMLHEILYGSLMAENFARVKHLEGAVKHLDEKSNDLARQCNAMRQEEIIEEIEVLLLSSGDEHNDRSC
jgi:F-type H+-transporting ATPase subunit gamma